MSKEFNFKDLNFRKKIRRSKPVYKELDVNELKLANYQRNQLSASRIKEYANKFDWDIFGVPLVSYRDGQYWIVDGQHRVEVLKLLGIQTVLCQVLTGLNYEEEAMKFVSLNSEHKNLNASEKFHGKVEGRDNGAVEIYNIMTQNGLSYSKKCCKNGGQPVSAIACVEKIYKEKGASHLNRVLNILIQACCGEKAAFQACILFGLSTFLSTSRGVSDGILISCLEKKGAGYVKLKAQMEASENGVSSSGGGGSNFNYVAKVIRDLYHIEKQRLKNHSIIA